MADPANKNDKVGGAKFISQSLKATPNTKNPLIIEEKEIITTFLNESSTKYRNITRVATKNNYYRAILTYIVLSICEVAMK